MAKIDSFSFSFLKSKYSLFSAAELNFLFFYFARATLGTAKIMI